MKNKITNALALLHKLKTDFVNLCDCGDVKGLSRGKCATA